MAVLRYSQQIGRSIHDVFAVVTDAGTFASWNPTIASSRRLDSGEIANAAATITDRLREEVRRHAD